MILVWPYFMTLSVCLYIVAYLSWQLGGSLVVHWLMSVSRNRYRLTCRTGMCCYEEVFTREGLPYMTSYIAGIGIIYILAAIVRGIPQHHLHIQQHYLHTRCHCPRYSSAYIYIFNSIIYILAVIVRGIPQHHLHIQQHHLHTCCHCTRYLSSSFTYSSE